LRSRLQQSNGIRWPILIASCLELPKILASQRLIELSTQLDVKRPHTDRFNEELPRGAIVDEEGDAYSRICRVLYRSPGNRIEGRIYVGSCGVQVVSPHGRAKSRELRQRRRWA
jgi:hypothetical protein